MLRAVSTFVLVHGAFHGGWCWSSLEARLRAAGHRTIAIDLPGHGDDTTPIAQVTLEDNVQRILDCLGELDAPAALVAHSLGGMAIAQAAEHAPERVARLVYVAALVPLDGQQMADLPPRAPSDPVPSYMERDEAAGTFTFRRDRAREVFYPECSDEVAAWATERLEPESLAASVGRARLASRAARVPRAYVECLRDRAITVDRQRAMQRAAGIEEVVSLDTDHSPFLSRPEALAAVLVRFV